MSITITMKKLPGTIQIFGIFLALLMYTACTTGPEKGNKNDVLVRFAVASDGHYGQQDTDYEKNFDRLIDHLNHEYSESGLDYTFLVGDIFHNDPELLPAVKKKLDGLIMPYYAIRGNHDMAGDWEKTWGYPDNFDFSVGDYAFVLASTSDVTGTYLCADKDWLWERLDAYQSKKGVFVFMHITPKDWTGAGINCPGIRDCLEAHTNVVAVYQGHDHREDSMKMWNGIPYYFDGHFGGSWGVSHPGYRIVEVNTDGSIRTYQYNMEIDPISNEHLQHLAFLKKGKLQIPPSEKYNPGPLSLTDGQFGSLRFNDGRWTGFEGDDFVCSVDLGIVSEVNVIQIDFLVRMASYIFPPREICIEGSVDGTAFETLINEQYSEPGSQAPVSKQRIMIKVDGKPFRYIRISTKNQGTCPDWHDGKGDKAWLFIDEIVIK